MFWGTVPFTVHGSANIGKLTDDFITPHLSGRPFSSWDELVQTAAALRERFLVERDVPATGPTVTSAGRRQLLRGLRKEQVQTTTETVERERPLPPELVWGVQVALLRAAAHSWGQSPADLVAALIGSLGAATAANTWQLGAPPETAASSLIFNQLDQIVIDIEPIVEGYGENAENLQRYLRQIREWMGQMGAGSAVDIQLVVRLNGVLGSIYDLNPGKMLGAIVGLEAVTRPIQLVLVDPVVVQNDPVQTNKMNLIVKDYMRLRRLKSEVRFTGSPTADEITPKNRVWVWSDLDGPNGLLGLSGETFDFIPPAGLQTSDLALLNDILNLLPVRSLWLQADVEAATYFLNQRPLR